MGKFLRLVNGIPRSFEEAAAGTIYDDYIEVVASGASGPNQINVGSATTGTPITLPNGGTYLNSDLQVFLGGDFVEDSFDYNYVGSGTRTQISFTFDLEVGDRVRFRKD